MKYKVFHTDIFMLHGNLQSNDLNKSYNGGEVSRIRIDVIYLNSFVTNMSI